MEDRRQLEHAIAVVAGAEDADIHRREIWFLQARVLFVQLTVDAV
jgi:hypothetical protein